MAPRSFTQVRLFLYYTSSPDSPLSLDLQPRNILLRIKDLTVLKEAEEAEIEQPSPRKLTEQTIIFEARDSSWSVDRWIGSGSRPVLCDFGEARTGKGSYTELIQPVVYRAPEVFLHLPWGARVDIWNFGCVVRLVITSPFLSLIRWYRYGTSCSVNRSSLGEVRRMN